MGKERDPTIDPTIDPVPASVLVALQERCRNFIKLDLGYLAAAGAVFTAFKLGKHELFEVGFNYRAIGFAFIGLLAFDALVHELAWKRWVHAQPNVALKRLERGLFVATSLQGWLHFLFITVLLAYFLGMSAGAMSVVERWEARATIHDEVIKFQEKYGRLPKPNTELVGFSQRAKDSIGLLGSETFRLEDVPPNGHRITFGGDDGLLDTADDFVASSDRPVRNFLDYVKASLKGGGQR